MRILVTGGCGYVGSVLVPKLIREGHEVTVVDLQWFGNPSCIQSAPADFQALSVDDLQKFDAVIHLAAIANDPTGELDPTKTWQTNALGTMTLAQRCVEAGVKQFIYASSGSVYGLSDAENVVEETPTRPLSAYNETKMVSERCLLSYKDKMLVQIVRPATVCGISPRMRFDLAVNRLAIQAVDRGIITVLGGAQFRPNIHILDMCDVYLFMLNNPQLTGIFNAGFENLRIIEIADRITKRTAAAVEVKQSNDPRSYRMNSEKLMKAGFAPKRTVQMAIAEIIVAYKNGELKDDDLCHNIRTMRKAA